MGFSFSFYKKIQATNSYRICYCWLSSTAIRLRKHEMGYILLYQKKRYCKSDFIISYFSIVGVLIRNFVFIILAIYGFYLTEY